MITRPEEIVFETTEDVIDYISKGLPPSKKNFDKVMDAWNSSYDEYYDEEKSKEDTNNINVIIPDAAKLNIDDATFNAICNRVYQNRIRNRNLVLGITAAVALGLIGVKVSSHNKNNKEDTDIIE